MHVPRSWLAVSLVGIFAACGETSAPRVPNRRQPAALVRLAGDAQVGVVGDILAVAPSVRVVDTAGLPVPAVAVEFAVVSGAGSIRGSTVLSDSSGVATPGSWRLGTVAGTNAITAAVVGVPLLLFTATGKAGRAFAITAVSNVVQTVPGGRTVPVAPAVQVRDTFRNVVPRVPVTFIVTTGGGSVSAPSALTDDNGVALAEWTLGTTLGPNTLTATVSGLPEVRFFANVSSATPATVVKLAGDSQTSLPGYPVRVPPSVLVLDSSGNPASAVVNFSVKSGNGTIGASSVSTDARGVASVGNWTLGSTAGPNSLTAAVSGLPGVTFAATAASAASLAATITKIAGDSQSTMPGTPVGIRPSVVVRDSAGNPAFALVTFRVTAGGGTITGASVVTDSLGIATVGGWSLGRAIGTNTLTASVPGVSPVTFTATGLDSCPVPTPYVIGSTVTGTLTSTSNSCQPYGFGIPVNRYDMNVPGTVSAELQMFSNAFYPGVSVTGPLGEIGYTSDCRDGCDSVTARFVLGAGHYLLEASGSVDYGPVSGDYVLNFALLPTHTVGCQYVFVTTGITTSQAIDSTDCTTSFRSRNYYGDEYLVQLDSGVTYTFSMASTAFDAYLEVRSYSVLAANDDAAPGTTDAQIVFTAPWSGTFVLDAETYLPSATGDYTLDIQASSPAPSPVRLLALPALARTMRQSALQPFTISGRPAKANPR